MRRIIRFLRNGLTYLGLYPEKTLSTLRGMPFYIRDLQIIKVQHRSADTPFPFGRLFPCLEDRFALSGDTGGHYFYQDLWVANRIFRNAPISHLDVGSRMDGFIAHVASFRPITVMDIRPQRRNIPNVTFIQADIMEDVKRELVECCDSLSSLHVVEHLGLGRYGDCIQYDGYSIGLKNLQRMLKRGGKLYLSVPIGPQRIEFNAHRVFDTGYLLKILSGSYSIDLFSYVDDKGEFHENAPLEADEIKKNFHCTFGCGIFELTKL